MVLILITFIISFSTINWTLVDSFNHLNDAYWRYECPSYLWYIFSVLDWIQSILPFALGAFLNLMVNFLASGVDENDDLSSDIYTMGSKAIGP